MPYKVVFRAGSRPHKIINISTGKQVGSSVTKADALASVRARNASEHGALTRRKHKRT